MDYLMNGKQLLSFHARVVKDINEQLVLKLIQENDVISSSELVRITGMRPSTIFNILKELSAKSFVSFHGKGKSTQKGGKKPYNWILNKDAACVIGIDIEVGEMTAVVLDFGGAVIAKKIIKMETGKTAVELTSNIINVVTHVILENKIDTEKVLGVGVAFAGIVDNVNGIVTMSSVVPEMNLPLLDMLKDLPFPVIIENNANAAAIGFKWKNTDKSEKNYLTVLVEIDKNVSGLGIGIIIDGKLYRGASFSAGELFPHLPTLKEIVYGFRSQFDESDILRGKSSTYDTMDIEFLMNAAKQKDKVTELIVARIGKLVGQTIAPVVAILNPDILIITGVISELENIIIDAIRKEIEIEVLSVTNQTLRILVDRHHHYSVAVGAASLILEDFFRVPSVT